MGQAIVATLLYAIDIYRWIVIAMIVYSWLYQFNVINNSNRFVAMLGDFLYKATEPVLRPIRRFMPNLGGIDISPIILFVAIFFIERLIYNPIGPAIISILG